MPLIRIPGMIDPHTHLRDLDWAHKATFASETAAAIAGGYTAVFDMPNTAPSTVSEALLDDKLARVDRAAHCDWGIYFGASQADNTGEYERIAARVCGLKIYNNSTTGDLLIESSAMRERHYRAWTTSRLIAVHAEDETVANILELVRKYRQPTHFLHISSQREIELLTAAKNEGLPVTVGVCPHHLFLTEDDLQALGGFGMMKPDLKSKTDQLALWRAIRAGVVDIIESDHAPHTVAEKEADAPAYGVPGLETHPALDDAGCARWPAALAARLRHAVIECATHLAHHPAAQDLHAGRHRRQLYHRAEEPAHEMRLVAL